MKTSLLLFIIMIASVRSYTSPSACTSTSQFYNPVTLSCESCPANTNQAKDFTYCNCTTSFYPDPSVIGFASNSSCQSLGVILYKTRALTLLRLKLHLSTI